MCHSSSLRALHRHSHRDGFEEQWISVERPSLAGLRRVLAGTFQRLWRERLAILDSIMKHGWSALPSGGPGWEGEADWVNEECIYSDISRLTAL
ncbi:hypothetical protein NMY22_g17514 [Coprinellus aureogranulatus]|nr:hypothetical protein NMY22_g17514 [Coprinellus aureogranulatus]